VSTGAARTIVEKIWTDHVVTQDPGAPAVVAIDLHLVHEVTSPQAFSGLRARGIGVRRPHQTVATADH
jgi:3-isopropylmalate/(R)-2-methylmalate dehydratase large subunit